MKVSIARIPVAVDEPVRIFFTGDWHVGNCNFDEDSARQLVKIIQESRREVPKTYVVTMGDLADLVVHSDPKRFVPATLDPSYLLSDLSDMPVKQINHIMDIFGPILPWTIARLTGNHEGEYKKRHHVDIHEMLFRRLARPDGLVCPEGVTYAKGDGDLGYVGFLRLLFTIGPSATSRTSVDLCLNHGDGGGGYREGYPTNKVHDVFRWSDADYAIMGHIHQLGVDCREHHAINLSGTYGTVPRWKGISGTLLRTAKEDTANYFEHKGRAGGNMGCLMAEMRFYHRRIDRALRIVRDLTLEPISLDLPKWKHRKIA